MFARIGTSGRVFIWVLLISERKSSRPNTEAASDSLIISEAAAARLTTGLH